MILILSNKWDISVDFVVRELRNRGQEFLRLNTEDLKDEKATVCLPTPKIIVSKNGNDYDLFKSVKVIWNRRPGKVFDFLSDEQKPTLPVQKFINNQWYSWLESLLIIPDVTWINHPSISDAMESKIKQLYLASSLGFKIPETTISNHPQTIQRKLNEFGGEIIAKALFSPLIEEKESDSFIFSNSITYLNTEQFDSIKICPNIFQESIKPKTDYRVTVVGERVFSVKIVDKENIGISEDWRTREDGICFILEDLPKEIEELCRKFVKQNGLLFGAIDLVKRGNDFYFLEINPNGEWGWLQKPHGIPIAEALADLMIQFHK